LINCCNIATDTIYNVILIYVVVKKFSAWSCTQCSKNINYSKRKHWWCTHSI